MTDRTSATISMQGTLDKQGKMMTWNWKKYWFVLKDNQLSYFKEDSRRSSSGLLDLGGAHSVRVANKGPTNGFPFEIVTRTRTHVFSAVSDDNRNKWIDNLQRAMLFKRSNSSMSSSTSSISISSMNRHKSFSTPSCESISDEEQMIYENVDEAGDGDNNDDVFLRESPKSNSPKSNASLHRSPPAIPDEPEDPLYATAEEFTEHKQEPAKKPAPQSNTYEYISSCDMRRGEADAEKDPDYAYSQVHGAERPRVEMRKSALRRLAGAESMPLSGASTASTDPEYAQVETVPRTPSDYKTPALEFRAVSGDVPIAGANSEESGDMGGAEATGRVSTVTLTASETDELETLPSDLHFDPIPELPHARVELTFGSAFDEIRRFIANNRGPSEMYAMPNKNAKVGEAVKKLKRFLSSLDSQAAV